MAELCNDPVVLHTHAPVSRNSKFIKEGGKVFRMRQSSQTTDFPKLSAKACICDSLPALASSDSESFGDSDTDQWQTLICDSDIY